MQQSLPFEQPTPQESRHAASQLSPEHVEHPEHPEHPAEFVRHPRARRYVVRVRADGTVRVTIPRWGSKREAVAFAKQQRGWIEKQLARLRIERNIPRE